MCSCLVIITRCPWLLDTYNIHEECCPYAQYSPCRTHFRFHRKSNIHKNAQVKFFWVLRLLDAFSIIKHILYGHKISCILWLTPYTILIFLILILGNYEDFIYYYPFFCRSLVFLSTLISIGMKPSFWLWYSWCYM